MKYPTLYRLLIFSILAMMAALTAGCVYFRLLQLKNQLGDFDHNFAAKTDDGVKIECLHPLLLAEDLRFIGIEPHDIIKHDEIERWHVRWIKDEPTHASEASLHDVELYLELKEEKLQLLQIPERYFEFFPKDLFVDLLRSTGKATIDKLSRKAEVSTGQEVGQVMGALPAQGSIEKLLGVPTERTKEPSFIVYRYRYRTDMPTGRGKAIEMIFFFDRQRGDLRKLVGKLPKGTMSYDFPALSVVTPTPTPVPAP